MSSNIFVAPKIKVGFQNRSGTFTGQLAYIIYYDQKGKLRKETSWESWRDKKIAPQEFENTPMEGFTINKDIKRYNGEWFSSTRTMVRIHDPRGFEFEVTTENLIAILMHTDCLRRGLIGQFVYAWAGPELVLLPTNSEEYQNAVKYTTGLSKKVSAKSLVPGISYATKRDSDVIYLGRFNWFEYPGRGWYNNTGTQKHLKVHVFTNDDGKIFFYKKSADFLMEPNNDVPVANYAELVEKFNKKVYSKKIAKFEFEKATFDENSGKKDYSGNVDYKGYYSQVGDFFVYQYISKYKSEKKEFICSKPKDHSGEAYKNGSSEIFEIKADRQYGYYGYNRSEEVGLEELLSKDLYHMYVVFEDGSRKKVKEGLYSFLKE